METVISSIFKCVASLEDMQFLVKYAAQVFPPSPEEARGELIWDNIVALQQDLRDKRQVPPPNSANRIDLMCSDILAFVLQTAVNNLITSMGQLYPEQLPNEVHMFAEYDMYVLFELPC